MDLVDFRCMEYRNGKVIANKETQERIANFGVRKIERETDIHHDTIILITKGGAVKPITLSKIIKFLDEQNFKEKPFSTDTLNDLPDPKKQRKLISLYGRRIKRLESPKHKSA